jgi:antitoxin component of RelBE/YafQ-DinJ toxin-antitoxin module
MRTTLDLDDAVLDQARAIARDRGISIGAAVSLLAERGMRSALVADDTGLPAFAVAPDARMLTPEMVRAALDDE